MQSHVRDETEKDKPPDIPNEDADIDAITYKVGKMVFVVTPVHRQNPGKQIHEILLDLMKTEFANL